MVRLVLDNISLGQYFNNGDNAATLTTIDPIFIIFQVPQNKVSNKYWPGDKFLL